MRVRCFCGAEVVVANDEYEKPYRVICQECRRSYKISVLLVPEKEDFWNV